MKKKSKKQVTKKLDKHPSELIMLNKWSDESDTNVLKNVVYDYNNLLDPVVMSPKIGTIKKVYDMREAANIHREVRRYIQSLMKPGVKYLDVCEKLENKTRELFSQDDLTKGIGFPTGFSVNNVAAHDSANPFDTRVIKYDDVIKVDFGTHVNGNIIDSAFTCAFNPKYEPLLEATKEGTWTGIKLAGPDALINDISKEIKEVIESYEIELNNKIIPITAITNLGGHTIEPYTIHAGKLVLGGPDVTQNNVRMKVNECFAIETFATTSGNNNVGLDLSMATNHYMINNMNYNDKFYNNITTDMYNHLKTTRTTLPFCTRWLNQKYGINYKKGIKELENKNIVTPYQPLVDTRGSYTSQLEHTIYLHDYGKEVLSYGDDY